MLEVSNLTKIYDDLIALDKVSFKVNKGEITGFLGPNGAGKTTTMRIITGYLYPDKGKITFEKKSLNQNYKNIISKIGYLPENNPLYLNLRVDEFLSFNSKFKNTSNKKDMKDIIKKCGLSKVLTKEIDTLSRGYKQRVGLAKALIGDPDYLILDEPTEGLDPNQKEEILNLIKDVSKEKTIIFSSHVLSEVTKIADKVIIINEGKIIAEGKSADLVKEHFKNAIIEIETNAPFLKFKKVIDDIKEIKGFGKLEKFNNKFIKVELNCTYPEKTVVKLFDKIVENKWKLRELHTKSHGLEELFKDLTK